MPLVMMVGIPCSGKTTRAKELEKYFKEQQKTVVLISDDDILEDKNKAYKDSANEKETRGKVKSAVERAISVDCVVIADSTNYIKGFRYELFCVSKAVRTPHCVVYCNTPAETAKTWNEQRQQNTKEKSFNETLLLELASRMEVPNEERRWDKPMFNLKPEDSTPCDKIFEAVCNDKKVRPNMSTLPQKLAATNLLYELDKITNEIVTYIFENRSTAMPGDYMPIPKSSEKLYIPQQLTLPALRQLRTQFIKVTQMHPPSTTEEIGKLFVLFMNNFFTAN